MGLGAEAHVNPHFLDEVHVEVQTLHGALPNQHTAAWAPILELVWHVVWAVFPSPTVVGGLQPLAERSPNLQSHQAADSKDLSLWSC